MRLPLRRAPRSTPTRLPAASPPGRRGQAVRLCLTSFALATTAAADEAAFFETEVRPLLTEHCVDCHNADDQQGGIRLDGKSHLLSEATGFAAVVPNDPSASRLLDVVAYHDDDIQMPPDGKLPDDAIAMLRQWIESGAYHPDDGESDNAADDWPRKPDGSIDFEAARDRHWAYRTIADPPVPPLAKGDAAVARTPVDAFILRSLREQGLSPSAEADPRTLLRRLAIDTVGLNPTYDEFQAFAGDTRPGAFERAVDRYLADPHFGERWGRHWLDVARYADTKGYVGGERSIEYPYAFTYRDWVIGAMNDDLPYDAFVTHQLAADLVAPDDPAAQAALGLLNVGPKFTFNIVEINNDRIDVITSGFLGTTVACARCHDHKFDPVAAADYWSMYAMLRSTDEPRERPLVDPSDAEPRTAAERDFARQAAALKAEAERIRESHLQELRADVRERMANYLLEAAARETWIEKPPASDPPLHHRAINIWSQWKKRTRDSGVANAIREAAELRDVGGDFPARVAKRLAEEAERLPIDRLIRDRVAADPPNDFRAFVQRVGEWYSDIDGRLQSDPGSVSEAERAFRNAFEVGTNPLTLPGERYNDFFSQKQRREVAKAEGKVLELAGEHDGAPPRAMALHDAKLVSSPVYIRGDTSRPGPMTPRRSPQLIAPDGQPFADDSSGRDELAADIVDPSNPLAARVIVNRVWQHYFGTGLVATPSDFGTRSDPPSHPELLDYLATRLIESDWSLKAIHREVLLSHAYRQSSDVSDEAAAVDPTNRLLSHQTRRRLEFEPMRDAILRAAGRLDETMDGRAVAHETPRRTVYARVNRNDLPDAWLAFDFPDPDQTTGGRTRTTVPQQSLYQLNSPLLTEAAQAAAARTSSLADLYRQILARDPSPAEKQRAEAFFAAGGNRKQLAQALLMSNEFHFVD